jgi:hypothetical protein
VRASELQNISLKFPAEMLLKPWLKETDPQAKSSFRHFCFLSIESERTMVHGNWHVPKALTEWLDTNTFFSAFSILKMLQNKRTVSA